LESIWHLKKQEIRDKLEAAFLAMPAGLMNIKSFDVIISLFTISLFLSLTALFL